MPGWDHPLPSKQYSGFLDVTDPQGQHIMMHYNFVESQRDPATDPVILWQQGGPGSSGFGYVCAFAPISRSPVLTWPDLNALNVQPTNFHVASALDSSGCSALAR